MDRQLSPLASWIVPGGLALAVHVADRLVSPALDLWPLYFAPMLLCLAQRRGRWASRWAALCAGLMLLGAQVPGSWRASAPELAERLAGAGLLGLTLLAGRTFLRHSGLPEQPLARRRGQRLRARDALRAGEERFRRMAESVPDVIFTATPDGALDFLSERFLERTGAEADPARGWRTALHPEDEPRVAEEWRVALSHARPFESRCRLRTRAGAFRWMIARAHPIHDEHGVVQAWFGAITDIHDLVEAETRSAEAEANVRALLGSTRDPVVSIDEHGTILTASASIQRTFGYTPAELVGQNVKVLMPEPHRSRHDGHLARYLATGQTFVLERPRLLEGRHRDGHTFPIELSVARVERYQGPPWFTGILRDVTQSLQTEKERAYLLESERSARMEAEHATQAKDEFLARLSHELRTPLNALLGWTQILRRRPSEETLAEGLEAIERSGRAQAQLIGDMLDVSRIVAGKLQMDVRPVPATGWVHAALQIVRPSATEKGVHLVADLPESTEVLRGDPSRLQQVAWNLLSNALKFTPAGGEVRVGAREREGWIELAVSDSGVGIAPEFLPFVFERYRQADASTTRRHGGLGLGLAIVKHLVALHGGQVEALSDGVGRGATFVVRLPLLQAARAREEGREPWVDPDLSGTTILVVDDDPEACTVIQRFLRECGARVETTLAAAQALERLEDLTPDLLLSDLSMPDMDGHALVRAVRAREGERRRLPALALSALARPEDRLQALQAGFDAHLAKPVERIELLRAVASALARRPALASLHGDRPWRAS